MKIKGIYTNRKYQSWPHWHIVHEWEDVIATQLGIPILDTYFKDQIIRRLFFRSLYLLKLEKLLIFIDKVFTFNNKYLVYEMYPRSYFSFQSGSNCIPIIIDFDYNVDIKRFNLVYNNCPLLIITNLEAYNYLKTQKCPLNILHWPLSLPDKYIQHTKEKKEFDVILAGRKNNVLWKYILQFEQKFDNIEYVHLEMENNKLIYKSNKRGLLGEFKKRDEFLELIKKGKISFYSTVGIDDDKRTKSMNHVTPRLFELLAAGCRLIGRYPLNSETGFFELEKVCPRVETYEEFETLMLDYLKHPQPEFDMNKDYLSKHSTSVRSAELYRILSEFNIHV